MLNILQRSAFRRSRGFTLIELLVVIGLIALLIALLFPAMQKLLVISKKKRAATQGLAIVQGIKNYRASYMKWPGQTSTPLSDTTYTSTTAIVMALDPTNNPRNLRFYEVSPGLVRANNFIDPWERNFFICMDDNADGKISMRMPDNTIVDIENETVGVVSQGPKPKDSKNWVRSWQP